MLGAVRGIPTSPTSMCVQEAAPSAPRRHHVPPIHDSESREVGVIGTEWVQTAGLAALSSAPWTPSDWGTIVIALSTVATLVASSVFYFWTWRQRNPRPVIVDTDVEWEHLVAGGSVTLELVFSNPGDVPIYPSRLITRVLGWKAKEAVASRFFTSRGRVVVKPRETVSIRTQLNPTGTGREAFPTNRRRLVTVDLLYVSGSRLRRSHYRRVEAITVGEGGTSLTHQPIRLRQAYRREWLARRLRRSWRRGREPRARGDGDAS